jgi:hypothetical protein
MLWIVGGWCTLEPRRPWADENEPFVPIHLADVWTSRDGLTWRCLTGEAPWRGRHSARCVEYAGKLCIGGGNGFAVTYRDVWSYEN